jgi:hypothetical protein
VPLDRDAAVQAAVSAQSLAEIELARELVDAWLADHPHDEELVSVWQRMDALERSLRAVGLTELPPSTGAR